jgi:hypothetical protein
MGGETSDKWLYTPNGRPAYYQQGKYLYTAQGGTCEYYEQDGWFHEVAGGRAAYYVQKLGVRRKRSSDLLLRLTPLCV